MRIIKLYDWKVFFNENNKQLNEKKYQLYYELNYAWSRNKMCNYKICTSNNTLNYV